MARDYQYVGTELELFRLATNWKKYLRKQIQPYIKGDVLEVGAGIGGTTRTLFKPESTSWTCLEPDRNLAEALQGVVDQLAAAQSAEMQTVIGTTNDLRKGDTRLTPSCTSMLWSTLKTTGGRPPWQRSC